MWGPTPSVQLTLALLASQTSPVETVAKWSPVARPALPVIIVLPRSGRSRYRASELIAGVDRVLRTHTRLAARFADLARVDGCLSSKTPDTYRCLALLCKTVAKRAPDAKATSLPIALIVSASRDADRVVTFGLLQFEAAAGSPGMNVARWQQRIVSEWLSLSEPVRWSTPAAPQEDDEVAHRLRSVFESLPTAQQGNMRSSFSPPTTVAVQLPGGPGRVQWSDQRFEVSPGITTVELTDLPNRPMNLHIDIAGYLPWRSTVASHAGRRIEVRPEWTPQTSVESDILQYSGIASMAAGLALGTYALVRPTTQLLCIGPSGSTPSECQMPINDERNSRNLNPLLPLGSGLVVLGATWAIGAWLEEGEGMPWWSFLLGLSGMAATFGAVYAAGL